MIKIPSDSPLVSAVAGSEGSGSSAMVVVVLTAVIDDFDVVDVMVESNCCCDLQSEKKKNVSNAVIN